MSGPGGAVPSEDLELPVMYVQPIVDLATGHSVAVEALARFPGNPELPVGRVFARAHAGGAGVALEAACIRAARDLLPTLPDGVDLAINVSPDVIDHPLVRAALSGRLDRIILEVTEQPATDPVRLQDRLTTLRREGAQVAVDDVTTGHAGLMRLASLRPDILKIDRAAVRSITGGAEQVAVVEALVSMARRLGCLVLAEGVETLDDVATLAALDVDLAQGWGIARPAPRFQPVSEEVRQACRSARRGLLNLEVPPPHRAGAIDIHHVTAELASTAHRVQLDGALSTAKVTLGVSMIAVSHLDGEALHEVIATGMPLDPTAYRLADYPATAAALRDGVMLEVSVDQPESDPAERALLQRVRMSSMLLAPLIIDHKPRGVLELFSATPRRWSARDLQYARILSQHVSHALERIEGG